MNSRKSQRTRWPPPLRSHSAPHPALYSRPAASECRSLVSEARVAVLLVDTDRASTPINDRIYGQFLEHINHSIEDGLFAEQVRGTRFEADDFKTY